MKTHRLIFWDQLSLSISSLKDVAPHDTIFMCELKDEATRVNHHPKKIALWFSAMRHFSQELMNKGMNVRYVDFNDPLNTHSLDEEMKRTVDHLAIEQIIVTEPGEYHFLETIASWRNSLGVIVEIRTDDRFLCKIEEFKQWADTKKELRMEYFYRNMRKKHSILIEADGSPTGGLWNYDKENRKSLSKDVQPVKRVCHKKSEILQAVLELVRNNFSHHFGDLDPFYYAITPDQATLELDHFIDQVLPYFGDYQDAMQMNNPYMYHSLLSSYINIGLLLPLEVCQKAEKAYRTGKVSLNCAEGFIRQILGWREFMRGIYWLKMPEYADLNALNGVIPLPNFYWGGKTHMACVAEAVAHTKTHAYSHHIQRLMVTGNFALLTGLDVKQVQEWYLSVYSDAYEWVEMPNTLGMSLFGDGGIVASKPYASSGQYINKMSDFCKHCFYDVKDSTGPRACPFNALYWTFLHRHRESFARNPRLSFMYGTWDKFNDDKKQAILLRASHVLNNMEEGTL